MSDAAAKSTPPPRTLTLAIEPEDRRVAALATAAIGLSLIDAAIPSPLPGVKPGLANIVTLVVLVRHGWATAAWVTALRVIVGSLLVGQLFAPGFFLSATGAVASLLTLGALHRFAGWPSRWFGPVSLSILAAVAHLAGQLVVARLWLIPHDGLYLLVPILAIPSLLFGTTNGLIAAHLLHLPLPVATPATDEGDDDGNEGHNDDETSTDRPGHSPAPHNPPSRHA
jgi:heptaprenyl diphosphate synthase